MTKLTATNTKTLYGFSNVGENKTSLVFPYTSYIKIVAAKYFEEKFFYRDKTLEEKIYHISEQIFNYFNKVCNKNKIANYFEKIDVITNNDIKTNKLCFLNALCYFYVLKKITPDLYEQNFKDLTVTKAIYTWNSGQRTISYEHKPLENLLEEFSNIIKNYFIDPTFPFIDTEIYFFTVVNFIKSFFYIKNTDNNYIYDLIDLPQLKFQDVIENNFNSINFIFNLEECILDEKFQQIVFNNLMYNHHAIPTLVKNFNDYNYALFFAMEGIFGNLDIIEKPNTLQSLDKYSKNKRFIYYHDNKNRSNRTFVVLFKKEEDMDSYYSFISSILDIKLGYHLSSKLSYIALKANLDCVKSMAKIFF